MDHVRFDELTKKLARGITRRETLRRLGLASGALAAGLLGREEADATTCREIGQLCRENANCCNETLCERDGGRGRKFCTCPEERDCGPDKCCDPGEYCDGTFCRSIVPTQTQTSIERAWKEILHGTALAPMLSLEGFEERVGARVQIHATPRPLTEIRIQAEVVAIEFPHRVVFNWQAPGMTDSATAEFALRETEGGILFDVNRLAGDPATCDLATQIMGSNWRSKLFAKTIASNLQQLQARPE